jgi:hypothetical protein
VGVLFFWKAKGATEIELQNKQMFSALFGGIAASGYGGTVQLSWWLVGCFRQRKELQKKSYRKKRAFQDCSCRDGGNEGKGKGGGGEKVKERSKERKKE